MDREKFRKMKLSDQLKHSFYRSFPYAVVASIAIFSAVLYFEYNRVVKTADLNHDGVTTEEELREVFRGIGKEYHNFRDIINNSKSIEDYCSKR